MRLPPLFSRGAALGLELLIGFKKTFVITNQFLDLLVHSTFSLLLPNLLRIKLFLKTQGSAFDDSILPASTNRILGMARDEILIPNLGFPDLLLERGHSRGKFMRPSLHSMELLVELIAILLRAGQFAKQRAIFLIQAIALKIDLGQGSIILMTDGLSLVNSGLHSLDASLRFS